MKSLNDGGDGECLAGAGGAADVEGGGGLGRGEGGGEQGFDFGVLGGTCDRSGGSG